MDIILILLHVCLILNVQGAAKNTQLRKLQFKNGVIFNNKTFYILKGCPHDAHWSSGRVSDS